MSDGKPWSEPRLWPFPGLLRQPLLRYVRRIPRCAPINELSVDADFPLKVTKELVESREFRMAYDGGDGSVNEVESSRVRWPRYRCVVNERVNNTKRMVKCRNLCRNPSHSKNYGAGLGSVVD